MADNLINIDKCIARKWAGGWGHQCSRNKIGETDYCDKHHPNSRTDSHGDCCDGDGIPIKRNPRMAGALWLVLRERYGIEAADNWYNNYKQFS